MVSTLLTWASNGDVMEDVKGRIAKASRIFECLRYAVFTNPTLSISTKRAVYWATVLAVLLYAAETGHSKLNI